MCTRKIGQAEDNDAVHEEDVAQVDCNAHPAPPVLVGHVQGLQDAVPQGQALVGGIGVWLVLPVTCMHISYASVINT